jgi:hypothetical protein
MTSRKKYSSRRTRTCAFCFRNLHSWWASQLQRATERRFVHGVSDRADSKSHSEGIGRRRRLEYGGRKQAAMTRIAPPQRPLLLAQGSPWC